MQVGTSWIYVVLGSVGCLNNNGSNQPHGPFFRPNTWKYQPLNMVNKYWKGVTFLPIRPTTRTVFFSGNATPRPSHHCQVEPVGCTFSCTQALPDQAGGVQIFHLCHRRPAGRRRVPVTPLELILLQSSCIMLLKYTELSPTPDYVWEGITFQATRQQN
jgi:hypothetical protein